MSIDPNTGLPVTPKKGMSGCMKAFLILGGLAVVLGVVCCGGIMIFAPDGLKSITNAVQVIEDPAKAAEIGEKIFEGGLGEDFPAKRAFVIKIPIVGPSISIVIFGDEAAGEMVVVGQLDEIPQGADKAQFEKQLRDAMSQQANRGQMTVVVPPKPLQVTVRGQPNEFTLSKVKAGQGNQAGVESWMANGAFEGKGGPAFMMVIVPASEYKEADVVEVIEKVK